MPNKKPAYLLHKPSGQARVRINGKDHYLGEFGSPESKERYDDLIAKWLVKQDTSGCSVTIDQLSLLFLEHADGYYRHKDGTPTGACRNFRKVLAYVVRLYGMSLASEFGPKWLKQVRQAMIDDGRCRTNINRFVNLVRQVFRWGVEEELVPPSTKYKALEEVRCLQRGRTEATEEVPHHEVCYSIIVGTLLN